MYVIQTKIGENSRCLEKLYNEYIPVGQKLALDSEFI